MARPCARKLAAHRVTAQTGYQLAVLHLRRGDLRRAEESFECVRLTARSAGDVIGQTYALLGRGNARSQRREFSGAEAELLAAWDSADSQDRPADAGHPRLVGG